MTMPEDRRALEGEIADEMSLVESSRPDEAMREPVEEWLFDPADIPVYSAVLHSLLGAANALDEGDKRQSGPGTSSSAGRPIS